MKIQISILATTVLLAAGVAVYANIENQKNDAMSVISLIQRNINPKDGSLRDYAKDINFTGPDCVGYRVLADGNVRIYFGDLQFDVKEEDLHDDTFKACLESIGITITHNKKTGKYSVKYHGEPIAIFKER